jgi:hypothetical protein
MLGIAPLAAVPLASAPLASLTFNFAQVAVEIALTLTVNGGATRNEYRSASIPMAFTLSPDLRVAGRPFKVFALPQSYTVRADFADYSVKAIPRSYTVRAKR